MTDVESLHRFLPETATLDVDELLFDMDGTLIDSIAAVETAWRMFADEEGIDMPSGAAFHGRTAADLVSSLVPAERFAAALGRLEEIERAPTAPVVLLPGTAELLAGLPADRWSVVTSAARPVALARLAAAGIGLPSLLVTGDDVVHGKPDPEPYRSGRRRSGRALAFEDTVAGLRSARAAGCATVGVLGTAAADELAPHADYLIPSLASVTVAVLDSDGIRLTLQLAP